MSNSTSIRSGRVFTLMLRPPIMCPLLWIEVTRFVAREPTGCRVIVIGSAISRTGRNTHEIRWIFQILWSRRKYAVIMPVLLSCTVQYPQVGLTHTLFHYGLNSIVDRNSNAHQDTNYDNNDQQFHQGHSTNPTFCRNYHR